MLPFLFDAFAAFSTAVTRELIGYFSPARQLQLVEIELHAGRLVDSDQVPPCARADRSGNDGFPEVWRPDRREDRGD